MQLNGQAALAAVVVAAVLTARADARAQVAEFDTTHSVFYEAPPKTHMFVYSPAVDAQATPWKWLTVHAGWEADVVSGASVATKAGSAYASTHSADVVSTASVHDLRNLGRGELTINGETTSLTAGYAYGIEHDYRSNSFHVNARTDAFQHNTQFELSYARNFDQVCDRVQSSTAVLPVQFVALENSTGCFTSTPGRTTAGHRDRQLRGELGTGLDSDPGDPAHIHGAARRRLPGGSLSERHPW